MSHVNIAGAMTPLDPARVAHLHVQPLDAREPIGLMIGRAAQALLDCEPRHERQDAVATLVAAGFPTVWADEHASIVAAIAHLIRREFCA